MQQRTYALFDELDNLLSAGKKVPLSSLCMVDRDNCRRLVREILADMPADITAAEGIIQNQASIISEAREIAEQTKAEANMRASRTVNDANANAQQTMATAQQKAQEMLKSAQDQARAMVTDAQEQARKMLAEAEARAKQLVSEQEVMARAQMEAEEIRQGTQEEIAKLYQDVYAHLDDVLAQLDRSISEKLTDIRVTRQQIGQSISAR